MTYNKIAEICPLCGEFVAVLDAPTHRCQITPTYTLTAEGVIEDKDTGGLSAETAVTHGTRVVYGVYRKRQGSPPVMEYLTQNKHWSQDEIVALTMTYPEAMAISMTFEDRAKRDLIGEITYGIATIHVPSYWPSTT